MPSEQSHIIAAQSNHETLRYLLQEADNHLPWIGTVAFYKALHVIDILFAREQCHPTTHADRMRILAKDNRMKCIFSHFKPLQLMSEKARYLSCCTEVGGYTRFDSHIPKQRLLNDYLFHHLYQVEQSAFKLLGIQQVPSVSTLRT